MGIEFWVDADTLGYVISCAGQAPDRDGHLFAQYDDACLAKLAHTCDDEDCAVYGADIHPLYPTGTPEALHVSQTNGYFLLQALGLTEESEIPSAEDLLGRVLMALAVSPTDEGVPSYDATVTGGPRWIECGRAPGYLHDRLGILRTLAEYAREHGRSVYWG